MNCEDQLIRRSEPTRRIFALSHAASFSRKFTYYVNLCTVPRVHADQLTADIFIAPSWFKATGNRPSRQPPARVSIMLRKSRGWTGGLREDPSTFIEAQWYIAKIVNVEKNSRMRQNFKFESNRDKNDFLIGFKKRIKL